MYTGSVVFEWDWQKAATNLRKHKVEFHKAATALRNVLSVTFPDNNPETSEERYLTIGTSDRNRILVVAHTEARDNIRIISARKPRPTNEGSMKKASPKPKDDDLRAEYDFAKMKGGMRGKYAARVRSGTNLVLLDPEIAKAFPTDASVNQTLRVILDLTARLALKRSGSARSSKRGKGLL